MLGDTRAKASTLGRGWTAERHRLDTSRNFHLQFALSNRDHDHLDATTTLGIHTEITRAHMATKPHTSPATAPSGQLTTATSSCPTGLAAYGTHQ